MATRILYIVNDPTFFLTHRLPLAIEARKSGYEVLVATGAGEGVDEIERIGFEHHVLPLQRSGINPVMEFRLLFAMARLYRMTKPDIVHLVTIKPVLYGGILSRLMRIPAVVIAVSGMGYLYVGNRSGLVRGFVNTMYRFALKHPNSCVIVQNEVDREDLKAMHALRPGQDVLIPGSGVNLTQYAYEPLPDGTPIVILPARMLWDKGVREFVEAAYFVTDQGKKARFALVGPYDPDNPAAVPLKQLEFWCSSSGGPIEWWGRCADMPQVYSKASLVVLPSYREGVPKALLEAAAIGRAIVATDIPGCRDVVEDGINGYLVSPKDAPALAEAIISLLSDRHRLEEMGRRGRKKAEQEFGVEKVIEKHMDIYASLCPLMKSKQNIYAR